MKGFNRKSVFIGIALIAISFALGFAVCSTISKSKAREAFKAFSTCERVVVRIDPETAISISCQYSVLFPTAPAHLRVEGNHERSLDELEMLSLTCLSADGQWIKTEIKTRKELGLEAGASPCEFDYFLAQRRGVGSPPHAVTRIQVILKNGTRVEPNETIRIRTL